MRRWIAWPLRRLAAGLVVCAAAATLAGCSVADDASPAATTAHDTLDAANGIVSALAEVGRAGEDRAVDPSLRALAGQLASTAQSFADQIPRIAANSGLDLSSTLPPYLASSLADLQSRGADQIDAVWLKLADDLLGQARQALGAVGASPDVSNDAKTAAGATLVQLDSLATDLQGMSRTAGATTPREVAAGDGGQAADGDSWTSTAGIGLIGLGVVLAGYALVRRRSRV